MAQDICVPVGDGYVNVRVGAIIEKDGKILMVTNESVDYYYSVGGRIHLGESAGDAVRREVLEETGCDSVMIARAAQGNPWIFREVKAYLKDGTILPHATAEERREYLTRQTLRMLEEKGEYIGIREMRKHVAWYTQGLPGSASIRREVNQVTDREGLLALIERIR